MDRSESAGFLSRIFGRFQGSEATSTSLPNGSLWADNAIHSVRHLVNKALEQPEVLVVTGYQDLLSTLSMLLETIPDVAQRPAGSVRVVFGTNTENRLRLSGHQRSLDEEARAYFLGKHGLSVATVGDLRAVLAIEALEKGSIALRLFDLEKAYEKFGRRSTMLHAKLAISQHHAISGSANFSTGGMQANLEFVDDVAAYPDAAQARRERAEAFWDLGVDWNASALEVLRGLLRSATPEEALARTLLEMRGFKPWRIHAHATAGRPPQPYQAELVYEAVATVYEHGFVFVEAPPGAGKTDVGKHLAVVLPAAHRHSVLTWSDGVDQERVGAVGLVPASVEGNWRRPAPAHFSIIRHSHLSMGKKDREAFLEEVRHKINGSSALIADESHRLSSRYLTPSNRALVYERSPAIWTACLSATLMGNQGLDGLLAFHEKRASIYASPHVTDGINTHMKASRARDPYLAKIKALEEKLANDDVQGDLFENPSVWRGQMAVEQEAMERAGLDLKSLQEGLSSVLAPFVVRRQRACVGESGVRDGRFVYPLMDVHSSDTDLTENQASLFERIKTLVDSITTGQTLVSAEHKRASAAQVRIHDRSRIHIRNFLALLRTSITFAREEWDRVDNGMSEKARRLSVGESLRTIERRQRTPGAKGQVRLPSFASTQSSATPICDKIRELLWDPALNGLDQARAQQMQALVEQHGHVIFLAERLGVLDVYASLLVGSKKAASAKGALEAFVVDSSGGKGRNTGVRYLKRGEEAQDLFGRGGKGVNTKVRRALFLTLGMAEGINLQMAPTLALIGGVSDIKSLIQGLGRIDRIDSPHSTIHYYAFDTPGLVLSSDRLAHRRLDELMALSGVGADEATEEVVEFPAAALIGRVVAHSRKERNLRDTNLWDRLESLHRRVPAQVLDRVRTARPEGVWGAEVCTLASRESVMVLVLRGMEGTLQDPSVHPPRLLAVRDVGGGQFKVEGEQVTVARLLEECWQETCARGLQHDPPSVGDVSAMLGRLSESVPALTHWDVRPSQTVSLLGSLARFLTGEDQGDDGRWVFGDLPLRVLQKLAESWGRELDPAWIAAKTQVAQDSKAGVSIPDYLGMSGIEAAFRSRDPQEVLAARERMEALVARCRAESETESIDVLGRVAVVFDAHPDHR